MIAVRLILNKVISFSLENVWCGRKGQGGIGDSLTVIPSFFLTCAHTYIYTPQLYHICNEDRHLEQQEWGVVSPAQLIYRAGSHPDVHQQARVETGRGCFPLHSLLHPSFTTRIATKLAGPSFFANYQLCISPEKTQEKVYLGRCELTSSFPP